MMSPPPPECLSITDWCCYIGSSLCTFVVFSSSSVADDDIIKEFKATDNNTKKAVLSRFLDRYVAETKVILDVAATRKLADECQEAARRFTTEATVELEMLESFRLLIYGCRSVVSATARRSVLNVVIGELRKMRSPMRDVIRTASLVEYLKADAPYTAADADEVFRLFRSTIMAKIGGDKKRKATPVFSDAVDVVGRRL